MGMWIGIVALSLVVVGILLNRSATPTLYKALGEAQKSGEIGGVIAFIEASAPSNQPTLWDQALGSLWQSYSRETAAHLLGAAVQRSDDDILQYWFEKILQVEPEIAAEAFSPEFVQQYFQPEVAARCGRRGCC